MPSHPGYVPYISGVVVSNDDTYQAEASALLDQLNAEIAQNPYEIPAYTLTVPLNVTFHVSYKKDTTPTPVQDTTVKYVFHDDTDNKAVTGGMTVTGQPGSTQSVNLTIPTGYKLAEGETLPTSVTMPTSDKTITIHLVHETKAVTPGEPGVTPDNPAYQDLFHKVTRTVIVNNPVSGQAETTAQTVVFGRTGVYDEVTKQFTSFGDWKVYANNKLTNETAGTWAEFDAPEFSGYTPSQAKVETETVNAETADQTVVINYTKTGNNNNNGGNDNHNNDNSNNGNNNNGNNGTNTNTTVNNTKKANTLPQTGNEQNLVAVAGLALAGLTAMLGLGGLKKKEN